VRVAGGEYPFRYGRVSVTAIQADLKAKLVPVSLLAQFTEDSGRLNRILFGVHGGIMQKRRLIVEPDFREAWLEEPPPLPIGDSNESRPDQ
jgi:hypothetical protein